MQARTRANLLAQTDKDQREKAKVVQVKPAEENKCPLIEKKIRYLTKTALWSYEFLNSQG
jgi:hypothetical protein